MKQDRKYDDASKSRLCICSSVIVVSEYCYNVAFMSNCILALALLSIMSGICKSSHNGDKLMYLDAYTL